MVIRDAWTKLNVLPALVIIREKMLAAYVVEYLKTKNFGHLLVYQFTKALNLIFCKGFLSRVPIRPTDTKEAIENMKMGFKFFETVILKNYLCTCVDKSFSGEKI
jgi:hypothetical protein